jgi:hypothetical protein
MAASLLTRLQIILSKNRTSTSLWDKVFFSSEFPETQPTAASFLGKQSGFVIFTIHFHLVLRLKMGIPSVEHVAFLIQRHICYLFL